MTEAAEMILRASRWRDIFDSEKLTDEQADSVRAFLGDVSPDGFADVLRAVYRAGRVKGP